jgi:predicted nucleic acid-binding protein
MISSSFPDVNVWLALLLEEHVHRPTAKRWWESAQSSVCFIRLTQVSVLRLLTTAAAMSGRPLRMTEAWASYDRLFEDDRVAFLYARKNHASPKLWADAWLLAFAECAGGAVVTFDQALAAQASHTVLLR